MEGSSRARARWRLLAHAVRKGHLVQAPATTTRHRGLDLFALTQVSQDEEFESIQYSPKAWMEGNEKAARIVVRQKKQTRGISPQELFGFDNTGIWPSEEVLAYYCIKMQEIFKHKAVCELGAGMGLAGLCLATYVPCSRVLITDGNEVAARTVEHNIDANRGLMKTTSTGGRVEGRHLLWAQHGSPTAEFDYIIASDCLFLEEYHIHFLDTAANLLKPGGTAFIFTPRRGGSVDRFVAKAKDAHQPSSWTSVDVTERYDELIWSKHQSALESVRSDGDGQYDPERHYPLLVTLRKE